MDISQILTFIGASVLVTLAPGPDIIFVITQSITEGRRSGIIFAFGLCSGLVVHTLAVALGVAAILKTSEFAFNCVKYAGSAYLIYLAAIAIKDRNKAVFELGGSMKLEWKKLYLRGVLMNILNPKVALFFLAFLPSFVSLGSLHPSLDMIMLGVIFMIQAIIVFSLVALFADKFSQSLISNKSFQKCIPWIKAVLFVSVSAQIFFSSANG